MIPVIISLISSVAAALTVAAIHTGYLMPKVPEYNREEYLEQRNRALEEENDRLHSQLHKPQTPMQWNNYPIHNGHDLR